MSKYREQPDYEERVDEASELVFSMLGGQYINHKTSKFKPGHNRRVGVVRQTLHLLSLAPAEIEDAIELGEECVLEHVRQIQQIALREQAEFREQIGV